MNWDNLRLGPQDALKPEDKQEIKSKIGKKPKKEESDLF
jgi:hypothetical protein